MLLLLLGAKMDFSQQQLAIYDTPTGTQSNLVLPTIAPHSSKTEIDNMYILAATLKEMKTSSSD